MSANFSSVKHLTLGDIRNVIGSLGDLTENTLNPHSLILVIGSSGETTFTQSGWKLLSEAGFTSPLAKIIINGVRNYATYCGDDCKYFLFIFREMFSIIYNKVDGNNEVFVRMKFICEINALKQILPYIFNSIRNEPVTHVTDSDSFSKDVYDIVMTFMMYKFSLSVSKHLGSLICDFIQNTCYDTKSLKLTLDYIISHFSVLCTKVLTSLPESRVLKGFIYFKKYFPPEMNVENGKFLIIWDLSMKMISNDVAWNITDESFVKQLNIYNVYEKIFDYLKVQNIKLLLTSSACIGDIKLLCEKNSIVVLDRLDKEDIQHILYCLHLSPLHNLNESVESNHIGELSSLKTFSINKSYFIHLISSDSHRFMNAYHILLCAPFDAVWKEYYSECLNCLKMVQQWLYPKSYSSSFQQEKLIVHDTFLSAVSIGKDIKNCDISSELKISNSEKENLYLDFKESCENLGIALPPCSWEFLLKTCLEKVRGNLNLPCRNVCQILHFAITKCICKKINVPFAATKNLETAYDEFSEKLKQNNINFLEPVIYKETMICSILDLILQLLKIDGIVSTT